MKTLKRVFRRKSIVLIIFVLLAMLLTSYPQIRAEASKNGWYYCYQATDFSTSSSTAFYNASIDGNTLKIDGTPRKSKSLKNLFGEGSKVLKRKEREFVLSDHVAYYNSVGEDEPFSVSREDFLKMGYVEILFHVKNKEVVYLKGALR